MSDHLGYEAIPATCPENYRSSADYNKAFHLWNTAALSGIIALASSLGMGIEVLNDRFVSESPVGVALGVIALGGSIVTTRKVQQLHAHCAETLLPKHER